MADVGSVAITEDIRSPFVSSSVGMAGTNVAGLKGLEVLESTQLVRHVVECKRSRCAQSRSAVWRFEDDRAAIR